MERSGLGTVGRGSACAGGSCGPRASSVNSFVVSRDSVLFVEVTPHDR